MAEVIKVPDIGDFSDVEVIEVLVKPGERVQQESPLITLESDKAAMDIPSPMAGTVTELHLKAGDKVSKGDNILSLETTTTTDTPRDATPPQAAGSASYSADAPAPQPAQDKEKKAAKASSSYDTELLVIGAGPGGYSAAFRGADLGLKTTLVERHKTLGGVCLNVGCIPSKALLHAARIIRESEEAAECGITYSKAQTDIKKLRAWTKSVITKLTSGLDTLAKQRKVQVLNGTASFTGQHTVELHKEDNSKQTISFANAIIATGSRIIHLPIEPGDDRVLDSTSALLLQKVPQHMVVIGGGIIGMEMATVYSALRDQK